MPFRSLGRVMAFVLVPVISALGQNNLVLSDASTRWTGEGNITFVFDDVGIKNNASPSVFSGTGKFRFLGDLTSVVSGSFSTLLPDVEIAKIGSAALELNQNLTVDEHVLISSGSCKIYDHTLSIGRNLTNQGLFYSGPDGTVAFLGTNNSQITMNSSSDLLSNLQVNKTAGGELKLGSSVQVSGEVLFASGNLYLNNWGLDLGTTGLLVNEANESRIYCDCTSGFVRAERPLGASGTFDPGNIGLEITTTGTAPGNTEVKRRHSLVDLSGNNPSSVYRYFEVVSEFNLNFNATVKFRYFDGEISPLIPNPIMDLYRSTDQGGNWDAQGALHDPAGRVVIKTGLPGFSWFAAGSGVSPLPVTLAHFEAVCAQEGVELSWTTESEINNMHFRVERSENFLDWTEVAVVPGAGNSNALLSYTVKDERPLEGMAYYRLTQKDYDGTTEVFDPISISCHSDESIDSWFVYPNPAEDLFTISVDCDNVVSSAEIQITDMSGKHLKTQKIQLDSGINEFVFARNGMSPGSYLVFINSTKINLNPLKVILK